MKIVILLLVMLVACGHPTKQREAGQHQLETAETPTIHLQDGILYLLDSLETKIGGINRYAELRGLVIAPELNCEQLSRLCTYEQVRQIRYLLINQWLCDTWPEDCLEFPNLEKLVIASSVLEDIPAAVFEFPNLKILEFESQGMATVNAAIPKNTSIEAIHLGYSPLQSLGTIKNLTTLKVLSLAADDRLAEELAVIKKNNPGIEIIEH